MFTRRKAIAVLPAGIFVALSRSAFSNPRYCEPFPTCDLPYQPEAANKAIKERLKGLDLPTDESIHGHYEAATIMIDFISKLAGKDRPVGSLEEFNKLCQPDYVDHVLTMNKKTDYVFLPRPIPLDRKNRLLI